MIMNTKVYSTVALCQFLFSPLLVTSNREGHKKTSKRVPNISDWTQQYSFGNDVDSLDNTGGGYPSAATSGTSGQHQEIRKKNEERRLFFPDGTELTFDPQLAIPIFDKEMYGIGSVFRVSLPLTIALDKLLMKSWSDLQMISNAWILGDHYLNRHKRSVFSNVSENNALDLKSLSCVRLSLERLEIFKKLENLIDSYGWRNDQDFFHNNVKNHNKQGKSCLLRAICEIHEFPMVQAYGFFGELVTLFVSLDKLMENSCSLAGEGLPVEELKDYIVAERHGVKGLCKQQYFQKCRKSLFTSI